MKTLISCLAFILFSGIRAFPQTDYCIPVTQAHCCGYGITGVTLGVFQNNSADGSAGFENFSALEAVWQEGQPQLLQVFTGGAEPHDVRAWIDLNNDGILTHPQELVFESLSAINPGGQLLLPGSALTNTSLRLRITADYAGSDPLPCKNPLFGQTEDYSVRIIPSGQAPVADFYSPQVNSCNGITEFIWNGTGLPSYFQWDFGDGQQSAAQNPVHVYQQSGIYTVSLTVGNSSGADTLTRENYIHVSLSETCDTFRLPQTGTSNVFYSCNFILTDNGGYADNYSDNAGGSISILPLNAQSVCLSFTEFHLESGFDFVDIYDGPTPSSPLLGRFTGNSVPADICSSGPSLCVKLTSDDIVNYPGFTARAGCLLSAESISPVSVKVYPNPFREKLFVETDVPCNEITLLEIRGSDGKTVLLAEAEICQLINGIDTFSFPPGIYHLRMISKTKVFHAKLIRIP